MSGFSPRDISNALRAVKTAGAGWIVSARDLAGNAADAYRLLQLLGVDRSAITIFLSGGGLSIVLTPEAFAALMHSQIASHIGDTTLHYPYTNGARDLRPRNSLHLLWFDPRLTNFVGGAGVYMELHADPDNPWTGSFSGHMGCVVFGVCPGI